MTLKMDSIVCLKGCLSVLKWSEETVDQSVNQIGAIYLLH